MILYYEVKWKLLCIEQKLWKFYDTVSIFRHLTIFQTESEIETLMCHGAVPWAIYYDNICLVYGENVLA